MKKAKIIYHLSFEFYKSEKIKYKDLAEVEDYIGMRVRDLAGYLDIEVNKIQVFIKLENEKI